MEICSLSRIPQQQICLLNLCSSAPSLCSRFLFTYTGLFHTSLFMCIGLFWCICSVSEVNRSVYSLVYLSKLLRELYGRNVRHTLQHAATRCNTLQHTATYCNTLQHTATNCNTLQHPMQHNATYCNTLQHTATHAVRNMYYIVAMCNTHCNTMQHTATHCNTLQHTFFERAL